MLYQLSYAGLSKFSIAVHRLRREGGPGLSRRRSAPRSLSGMPWQRNGLAHRGIHPRLAPGNARQSWLGGRDSNPDKQIQSLPCYRYTTSQHG